MQKTTNITLISMVLQWSWIKGTTSPSDILEDFASLTFWIAPWSPNVLSFAHLMDGKEVRLPFLTIPRCQNQSLFTKRKMAWEWSDPCLDKLRLFMWKSIFLFYSHAIDQIPRVLSWIIPFSPQFLSIHQFTTWLVAGGGPLGWLSCQILELQTAESCSPAS